jgi:hypothetical protein
VDNSAHGVTAKVTIARVKKRRSFSIDPRLLIGLLLVGGSIAGVVALVSAADKTVVVLAARDALAPGDRVQVADLEAVDVRLAAVGEYLAPGDIPPEGVVVARAVGEGELVPASAIGSVDGLRLTSLVLSVGGQLAASIDAGSTVDVWAAHEGESGEFGPPSVVVPGATVVRLVLSESVIAGGETTAIEVLVPKARVARVLQAVANGDALSVVPAMLPGRR